MRGGELGQAVRRMRLNIVEFVRFRRIELKSGQRSDAEVRF